MTGGIDNLSREKIHRLLAAIGSRTPDDNRPIEATEYDWHQPHCFTSDQLKKLTEFAGKAAATIARKIGVLCQSNFEVKITSISQHFAGNFLGQANTAQSQAPDNYYLPIVTSKEQSCGFLSIPPQTANVWATQLLGEAAAKENTDMSLSKLEESLLLDMAILVVQSLSESDPNCTVRPRANALTNRMPLELKGTEEFCKISFAVRKDASQNSSDAHILILCETLTPVVGETTAGELIPPKDLPKVMLSHIEKMPVAVTARLATAAVTVEQMIGLAADDLLLLDKKITEPIELIVEGRTLCHGRCGKTEGSYAFVVNESFFTALQA